jgi:SAM-dependent methyltransferase
MDLIENTGASQRRHPWEQARFAFFRKVLGSARLDADGMSFLDVGAGDGWFARQVAASAPGVAMLCWDTGYDTAQLPAGEPAGGAVRFTPARPRGLFDVVLLLDVLEHVPEDRAFLADLIATNLRPGGRLLFSVPAWPWLFSSHDAKLRHQRRYTPNECRRVLGAAGLEIERSGGLFHSLLPVRALQVSAERVGLAGRQRHAGEWRGSAGVTRLVQGVLGWDAALSLVASARGWDVPGLSWWALCRKPS